MDKKLEKECAERAQCVAPSEAEILYESLLDLRFMIEWQERKLRAAAEALGFEI